jgi:hypothetical protein
MKCNNLGTCTLGNTSPAIGDLYALAQPLGFGAGYYLTEKMMRANPSSVLSITAVQTAVVGVLSLLWMLVMIL